MENHPGQGVMKEEKFPNTRKPSHRQVYGKFWNLRGQHNQEGEKTKQNKTTTTTQNMCLMATTSREIAQTLASTTSEQGLDREALVVCLR